MPEKIPQEQIQSAIDNASAFIKLFSVLGGAVASLLIYIFFDFKKYTADRLRRLEDKFDKMFDDCKKTHAEKKRK